MTPRLRRSAGAFACTSAGLVLGVGAAFLPAQAQGGPIEVLAGLTVHPTDGRTIVLGYENGLAGLLVSSDGGRTFRLRPSQSVHTLLPDSYFPRQDFPILLTPDVLLVGGTGGLLTGDAETCGLAQGDTLLDDTVWALAAHPRDPSLAFMASLRNRAAHGGLFRRDRTGTLAQLGEDDDASVWVTGLRVVTRDASVERLRFVEAGSRLTAGAARAAPFVRHSDDMGMSWTEHTVTLPGGGSIGLLAVDPLDPARLLLMGRNDPVDTADGVSADPGDDVLLSLDAGQSFSPYDNRIITARHTAFAPDGRFWLGDVAGGLYFARRLGEPLRKVADVPVRGLWFDANRDELLVAQSYELGRFTTADYRYCQMFRIYEALGYPACRAENIATDPAATAQVCGSFCNATHYWYAPICKTYDDAGSACGLGVLGTPFAAQLPNTTDVPSRCDGFSLNYTAPTSGDAARDAGASDRDGSSGRPLDDGGGGPTVDAAGLPTSGDAAPCAGDAAPPCPHSGHGCSVPPTNAAGADRFWQSAIAAVVLFGSILPRRDRRARRRARLADGAARAALPLLCLLGGAGCGDPRAGEPDAASSSRVVVCPADIAHSPLDIDSAGVNGTLHAKVVAADHDPARKYLNAWTVALTDSAGQPVSEAQFENQRTYMPVHGHDGGFPPTITPNNAGPGQYDLTELNFIMTGPWQVQFDVRAEPSAHDRFSLDVCVGG